MQPKGPYNLLAETWSGALALQLGLLLEAKGHQAYVFLVDAAPSPMQQYARMLFAEGKKLFTVKCLSTMLNLDSQVIFMIKYVFLSNLGLLIKLIG